MWHGVNGLPNPNDEHGRHHPLPDRAPRNGITVLIAGAGFAGMAAALEIWRKGMDVQILEKTQEFSIAGALVSLPDPVQTHYATDKPTLG